MKMNVKLIFMRNCFRGLAFTFLALLHCGSALAQFELTLSENGKKEFQLLLNIREDVARLQQDFQELKIKLSRKKGVISAKEKIALADMLLKMDSLEKESMTTTLRIFEGIDEAALVELEKNIPQQITSLNMSYEQDLQKKLAETPKGGMASIAFDPAFGRKNRSEVQALYILQGAISTAKIKLQNSNKKMSTPSAKTATGQ